MVYEYRLGKEDISDIEKRLLDNEFVQLSQREVRALIDYWKQYTTLLDTRNTLKEDKEFLQEKVGDLKQDIRDLEQETEDLERKNDE